MRSLDTNAVLRLLLNDIPAQSKAIEDMLASARPNSFFLADAVFFECVWVLSGQLYGFDRAMIGKMLLGIARIDQINCNRALIGRAIPLYVQHKSISFIDVCLAVYAELNDAAPLLTYDRRLVKALPHITEKI